MVFGVYFANVGFTFTYNEAFARSRNESSRLILFGACFVVCQHKVYFWFIYRAINDCQWFAQLLKRTWKSTCFSRHFYKSIEHSLQILHVFCCNFNCLTTRRNSNVDVASILRVVEFHHVRLRHGIEGPVAVVQAKLKRCQISVFKSVEDSILCLVSSVNSKLWRKVKVWPAISKSYRPRHFSLWWGNPKWC